MSDPLTEHIEYLTLPGRNDLYRAAIGAVLKEGDKVADLGCGVGVLGFLCLEAGAAKVYGIDHSDAIHLARESAVRAGYRERYECMANSTFWERLPEPVDLLICDHVGFLGVDYGIINMLTDARDRMLKPGGKIMPESIDLILAAASSDECRELAGVWSSKEVPDQFHWLDEYNRNTRHSYQYKPEELISSATTIGSVAFDTDIPKNFSFQTTLHIATSGMFEGMAGWFDCHLGGGVRMTNSPLAEESIKRPQTFLPIAKPFPVKEGDQIPVSLKFLDDGTMITWSVQPPDGQPKQTQSTWSSTILRPEDMLKQSNDALQLSDRGKAVGFILSKIDQGLKRPEIESEMIARFPDLFPTDRSAADYVGQVITNNCKPNS